MTTTIFRRKKKKLYNNVDFQALYSGEKFEQARVFMKEEKRREDEGTTTEIIKNIPKCQGKKV